MNKNCLCLICALVFFISLNFVCADNLTCWFDPVYQEPDGLRDVWCNFTNSSGDPILSANISHSTYDTNDWYMGGLMNSKGWFIGYNSIPNAYNLSVNDISIYGTKRIDSTKSAHIKYGSFTYPFPHINQTLNLLLKAGSDSQDMRISICNDSYSKMIFGNTPINLTRTSNYSGCMLAGTINASQQGINYNNWTWATLDITNAYNTITPNQSGVMDYSIHISSYDEVGINPVGWSINDMWMPPSHNETKEAFVLNSTTIYTPNESEIPSGCFYNNSINMSGNVLHFRLNDAGTNIEDSSCMNNNGIAHDNPILESSGRFNYGVDFTLNRSRRIVVADNDSLDLSTEGTLMTWIYLNSSLAWAGFIHKGQEQDFSDEAYAFQFGSSGRRLKLYISNGTSNVEVDANSEIELKRWYHVAATWNSTTKRIYLDGIENKNINSLITPRNSGGSLQVGAQLNETYITTPSMGMLGINGLLDEVMIFNRTLSSNEIKIHYLKGMNNFLPDNRVHNISNSEELWGQYNLLKASDSITTDSTTNYTIFDNNADYLEPQNISSRQALTNSSFTLCYFFKRTSSGEGNYRIEKWGETLSLHVTSEDIRFSLKPSITSTKTITTNANYVADTDWHHVCAVRDKSTEEMRIILDGEKVASQFFNNTWELKNFNEVVIGRDIVSAGSDEGFRGQLAQSFLHNDSHTSGEILEGINNAWWEIALSEQTYENVYSEGTLINGTTYFWENEPEHTPVAFLKIYNMNNDSAYMDYNDTNHLYHYTYYTSKPQLLSSQGTIGVNFTTLFEYNTTLNDTAYWHVAGASNATCDVSINWNYPDKEGQFQLARINFTSNSTTSLNTRKVYVCDEGETFPDCQIYTNFDSTFHRYLKKYGNTTAYCEVKNDYMAESYIANNSIDVGCWSAYEDYDGSNQGIVLESDLHVCSGYHKMISLNNSDDAVINNPSYKIIIPTHTIFDGGGVREGGVNDSWHQFIWAYDVNDCRLTASNVTFQNGEIGIFIGNSTDNCTYANIHFINMSIGFDIESSSNQDLYILNNTFDNCGIDYESSIYISTENVNIIGNRFNSLSSDALANIESSGSKNITLEQNYYWDVSNLAIYSRGNNHNTETNIGNLTCEIGEYGSQYPYSNFQNFSEDYLNGASLSGEIIDYYPCTNRLYSSSETDDEESLNQGGGYAPKIYYTTELFITEGNNFELRYNDKIKFVVNFTNHTLTMQNFNSTSAKVKIESEPIIVWLEKDVLHEFDLDNDSVMDVRVKYEGRDNLNRAKMFIQEIVYSVEESLITGEAITDVEDDEKSLAWLWIISGMILALIVLYFIFCKKKSKKRYYSR